MTVGASDGREPSLKSAGVVEIDGASISSLEDFFARFEAVALDTAWGRNLDAFNDVLRGGFGTPAEGFVFRWRNHDMLRTHLGHGETVRQLEQRLARCHPSNRASVAEQLRLARLGRGPTVFDWLVDIVRRHGQGGEEAGDNVSLELC